MQQQVDTPEDTLTSPFARAVHRKVPRVLNGPMYKSTPTPTCPRTPQRLIRVRVKFTGALLTWRTFSRMSRVTYTGGGK